MLGGKGLGIVFIDIFTNVSFIWDEIHVVWIQCCELCPVHAVTELSHLQFHSLPPDSPRSLCGQPALPQSKTACSRMSDQGTHMYSTFIAALT